MGKQDEPAIGIPYAAGNQPLPFYVAPNPYQAGMVPPNAIYDDPKGVPIHQTFYRDTPAPFNGVYCGGSSLTTIRSKPSLAAVIGCMMPLMLGFCFLCPSMDCLWHKYHHCPSCGEKQWFDIEDWTSSRVQSIINEQLQSAYRHWRNTLNTCYKRLKEKGLDVRENSPRDELTLDEWKKAAIG